VADASPAAALRVLRDAPLNVSALHFAYLPQPYQTALIQALRDHACHRLASLRLDVCTMASSVASSLLAATAGLAHVKRLSLPGGDGAAVLAAACPAASVDNGVFNCAAALTVADADELRAAQMTQLVTSGVTMTALCAVLTELSVVHKIDRGVDGVVRGYVGHGMGFARFAMTLHRTAAKRARLLVMRMSGPVGDVSLLFANVAKALALQFPCFDE
jgi:hypothetical protein